MKTTRITYTLEHAGRFYIIENVPARIDPQTGEPLFAAETVEHLHHLPHPIRDDSPPARTIETPVYVYADAAAQRGTASVRRVCEPHQVPPCRVTFRHHPPPVGIVKDSSPGHRAGCAAAGAKRCGSKTHRTLLAHRTRLTAMVPARERCDI